MPTGSEHILGDRVRRQTRASSACGDRRGPSLVLALLVAPLRADLGLNDLQLGLLFGPAFGLFYAALGLDQPREFTCCAY